MLSESGMPGAEHGIHAATHCVSPRQLSQRHCERESLCRCAQIRPSSLHCAFASCPSKLSDSVKGITLAVSQSPRLSFCDFADAGLVTCIHVFACRWGFVEESPTTISHAATIHTRISKSAKHNPYSATHPCARYVTLACASRDRFRRQNVVFTLCRVAYM